MAPSPSPSTSTSANLSLAARARGRVSRPIETILLASTACLLAAVAWPIAMDGLRGEPSQAQAQAAIAPDAEDPTIQLALILDTSSSMDGLIDQARTQLWTVVNTLDGATFHGATPRLEIAIYEYGNDTLSARDGWIRQVQPFTSELDVVSEALFSLTTNGGRELAGRAIERSVEELDWRGDAGTLRIAYVAGNEDFEQGLFGSKAAINDAREQGIVVNTVFCGSPDDADADGWRAAADHSGGRFASIDHNYVQAYIAAPQDDAIARIGQEINDTYIRYGADGARGYDNLVAQDGNMAKYGKGNVVTRSVSKSSRMYRNDSWDLVDAIDSKSVGYGEVDRETLPEGLRGLSDAELEAHVEAQKAKRTQLQGELSKLASEREEFLAEARTDGGGGLDQAILGGIREQAEAAGFTLD